MIALTKTEMMVLAALARGATIGDYKHLSKEIYRLNTLGYIHCIFDEQNQVISGNITTEGKKLLFHNL